MWYRLSLKRNYFGQLTEGNPKSKPGLKTKLFAEEDEKDIDVSQLPDIQEPEIEESPVPEQPLEEVPVLIESENETPVGVENRKPLPITLPPGFKVPPVHEFCHCNIETLVSGQQIWKLGNGENHCVECVNNMQIFNLENERVYNQVR